MDKQYDVIIVGAGPAGIFSALELVQNDLNKKKILILEKGRGILDRKCPMRERNIPCQRCTPCSLLCGWGGGGAFSDGKLNLTSNIGGHLSDYRTENELEQFIQAIDRQYLRFGADEHIYGANQQDLDSISRQATESGLIFIPARIRHLGTEKCFAILKKLYDFLKDKIEIRTSVEVAQVITEENQVKGVLTAAGENIKGRHVILSPGRVGAEWLKKRASELKVAVFNNPVDVGVRVELPAVVLEDLTHLFYESKLVYYTSLFHDKVRTFCMCPYGEVVTEYNDGITTVNGHSYRNRNTTNTNFALLVSTRFTEPFKEPNTYGRYIANLANILSGGVIIQRLGDLMAGRRSTIDRINRSAVAPTLKSATPGDLSFVLPYRILSDIIEMLKALDKMAPGVFREETLLYGAEVKFYSARLSLSPDLETSIANLFAIGDGAGITRGLIQASISGVIAAREIQKRMKAGH